MSVYRVKTGLNQALVDLVAIDPQPRSPGIQTVQRNYAISGLVYEQASFVALEFDFLESPTEYQAVLTQFGLDAALTAEVTVYVRDFDFSWVRKNGLAVRPEVGKDVQWQNFFPRSIEIIVKHLTTAV